MKLDQNKREEDKWQAKNWVSVEPCRTKTELWLTFMWRHQQVDSLLRQVGPHSVYLSLQVHVVQMLRQDPWGRAHKHVTSNLHRSDHRHSHWYQSRQSGH